MHTPFIQDEPFHLKTADEPSVTPRDVPAYIPDLVIAIEVTLPIRPLLRLFHVLPLS